MAALGGKEGVRNYYEKVYGVFGVKGVAVPKTRGSGESWFLNGIFGGRIG